MFNLFNKTPDAGAPDADFPQGKYLNKDAGIPGSPVQADMRNDIYIFFSRLFSEVGFVFNDVADTVLASQAFDAFKNFLQPVLQLKLDTETITPANRHINAEIDTGSGDADIILDVGTFEGQTVNVTVNDLGIGSVDWGGGYLIYISLNSALTTSLIATFIWTNGAWVVTGGVTATYVSGTYRVFQKANGTQKIASPNEQQTMVNTTSDAINLIWPSAFATGSFPNAVYTFAGVNIHSNSATLDTSSPGIRAKATSGTTADIKTSCSPAFANGHYYSYETTWGEYI